MATTTTLNGTITSGATQITLTAYTNPVAGLISAPAMLRFATGEKCRIADASLSPTLTVVRGYEGTEALAHTTGEGVIYGLVGDSGFTEANTLVGQHNVRQPSGIRIQAQEVTATGSTGSTAAILTGGPMLFVNTTGASGAGINLWSPLVGDTVIVHNDSTTGSVIVYSVGATLAGVTGVTGVTITQTGTKGAIFCCSTAGAWKVAIAAT